MPTNSKALSLKNEFLKTRKKTLEISANIPYEDKLTQCQEEVSPTKWHLAHTTWFYEKFIAEVFIPGYKSYDSDYTKIFNSYYETVGKPFLRRHRYLLSRPSLDEVLQYRAAVDEVIIKNFDFLSEDIEILKKIELGIQHEKQHQELILTDIKLNLWHLPTLPNLDWPFEFEHKKESDQTWITIDSQICTQGNVDLSFCFDNEQPSYSYYLNACSVSSRLVRNDEYLQFIEDGGYKDSRLWLSDGWNALKQKKWACPLYWIPDLTPGSSTFRQFSLSGIRELNPVEPVSNISFYEADAFARWAGLRLVYEQEWEYLAKKSICSNFSDVSQDLDLFGVAWQWTSSAYTPYPGFNASLDSLGEYNGKFMSGQIVLRGSSDLTSENHSRPSYRNFFPPSIRWQKTGIRLAKSNL